MQTRAWKSGWINIKNVYSRPEKHTAWEVVHEYRRIPKTRYSSSRDMKIIGGNNLFTFAVDNNGKFWKKYLNYEWKEFIYDDLPKYGLTSTIIGCLSQHYWTRESKNRTIIKRYCELPLRDEKKRKADPDFNTLLTTECIKKRRQKPRKKVN